MFEVTDSVDIDLDNCDYGCDPESTPEPEPDFEEKGENSTLREVLSTMLFIFSILCFL